MVFHVSADGLHGLIAETVDQGKGTWKQALDIAKTGVHSDAGKAFTDWRLPTRFDLTKLFNQKNVVGGFAQTQKYWSATDVKTTDLAWYQNFNSGLQINVPKNTSLYVRAIRSF